MKDEGYAFILIAGEEYWDRLRQRASDVDVTLAFVRKGQVGPVLTKKLIFYVKKPFMQIRGTADFIERLKGDGDEMWTKYGTESCFNSKEEYDNFVQGRDRVTVVRFRNLSELKKPKPAEEICIIIGSLRGFRGRYVDSDLAKRLMS